MASITIFMTDDVISREHLLSGIDELMQSPWFNNGKDDRAFRHYGYVERKEAVEVVRDLCVKAEPSVTPKQPFINKPCVSSGVCEHDKQNVLDKIKAELEKLDGMYVLRDHVFYAEKDPKHVGLWYVRSKDVLDILDKYKEGESE